MMAGRQTDKYFGDESACEFFLKHGEELNVKDDIGERLVSALKDPQKSESNESFMKAMELTKAYASSGSITHFSAVARTFYELFEMFETGRDPRQK